GFDIDPYMVSATKTLVGDRARIEQRDVLRAGLPEMYDVIPLNPPYSPDRTDTAGKFRCQSANPALQTIEVCLGALKPGGRLAGLLGEGRCSRLSGRLARRALMRAATITMVGELGGQAFRESAGTRFGTSILIFDRRAPSATQTTKFF